MEPNVQSTAMTSKVDPRTELTRGDVEDGYRPAGR